MCDAELRPSRGGRGSGSPVAGRVQKTDGAPPDHAVVDRRRSTRDEYSCVCRDLLSARLKQHSPTCAVWGEGGGVVGGTVGWWEVSCKKSMFPCVCVLYTVVCTKCGQEFECEDAE